MEANCWLCLPQEQRNGLLTGFSTSCTVVMTRKRLSQSAGCSDEFWELSLGRTAFLVPTPPSPLLGWPSTPGTKPWECELCRAAARTPVQTANTGKSLLRWTSSVMLRPTPPWPLLPLWSQIIMNQTSVFTSQALTQARHYLGGNPRSSYQHFSFIGCPSLKSLWAHLPKKQGHNEAITHLSRRKAVDLINTSQNNEKY